MRAVASGVEAGPVMVHRPIHDGYAGRTVSCSAERSSRAASGADAVLVFGPGSCLEVSRRRTQNGSGGGMMMGQWWGPKRARREKRGTVAQDKESPYPRRKSSSRLGKS
jgi:hypothetical protein